jgi:uncharacterized protein (TIGR02001 family)
MKSTKKLSALAAALIVSAGYVSAVQAEISANVGLTSQYFFRGIAQTSTASASAGVDYENGGFYAGTWAADVEDGLEIDVYAGYGFETESGVGLSAGFTSYQYTDDFDTEYNEINLGLSYGIFSLSYNIGEYDTDPGTDDYSFLSLTVENNGFYATYGSWGKDFDGDYVELGYGTEIGGFDASVAVISSSDLHEASAWTFEGASESSESLVFSIGKSF